jgi:hypothetical protein
MVKTLQSMTDLTRQGLMDAVHSLKASDIPMLLPGVTLDGTIQSSSPLTATRLLKFSGGNWSLAATG